MRAKGHKLRSFHPHERRMFMQKETLAQMNLLEDFLFETVLSYPELGEKVGKKMLEIIFGRKIGKVRVVPQKNFNGSDIGFHGARLDVYMEEESDGQLQDSGSVYDIEPERDERLKSIKTLPRRVRFYHSKIDAKGLRAGMDYGKLKNVTIIMITPFDPFGMDRVKYTIRRGCLEEPDMPYDDGEETVFLYTRGQYREEERRLWQFLNYMEHSTAENACNEDLEEIHRIVEEVRQDEEVSLNYMKVFEERQWIQEVAEEKGRLKGLEEGIKALVETCHELGISKEETVKRIEDKFRLTTEEAGEYVNDYWIG